MFLSDGSRYKWINFASDNCSILMNPQEGQTLQLREMVVWTPDGMTGEVIV
jgi:hypothetical protein